MTQTRTLFLVWLTCFVFGFQKLSAQKHQHRYTYELVQSKKGEAQTFPTSNLFSSHGDAKALRPELGQALEAGTLLELNDKSLFNTFNRAPKTMTMQIPSMEKGLIELELVQVDILAPGFQVIRSSDNQPVDVETGVHYHGIIKGKPNSVAAISIFRDQIMGMVSSREKGNLVLGRLDGLNATNAHILYNDSQLKSTPNFSCETPDDHVGYSTEQLQNQPHTKALSDCIGIYVVVEKDIHDDKGGVSGATSYITGVFNQSFVLYANDQINMNLSEIFVYNTTDPYTSGSSSGRLSQFQSNTGSFNGDLAHLVSYGASGGIAAGFAGLCNSNPDNSKCFSSIQSTFSNVPTYSWSVMVVTHEMGHLVGSRHTHACVWNGNNTAIDGCAGGVEGGCSLPGYPSNGGTLMSYCHLQSVGINFNNGFGPQPGAVVRNSVTNASCLSPCNGGGGGGGCATTVSSFPYSEGFESGEGWSQASGDDFDWTRRSGTTPSSNTGPSAAATGTWYMYMETSSPNYPSRTSNFDSPCFDLSSVSNPEFSFSYHMLGNAVGTLNLQASTDDGASWNTVWTRSGTQGSSWNSATVDLATYAGQSSVQLRFNGTSGSSWQGDMCIDDLSLVNNSGGGGGGNCTDVNISITLDNYPGETSWDIRDSGGNIVASGGTYGGSGQGTTVNETVCLDEGCYDFTINDSYGDGICCGFGNGSYTVSVDGSTVASGGSFGTSETTNFCVGGGGGPSCPTIDFSSTTINSYGGSQDAGTSQVTDGGATLIIQNNAWKSISLNYTVTANTVIEFDFGSTTQGEIHGIGFDSDNGISSNLTFKVHGTQNWGITNYDNYPNNSTWVSYTIPVGNFYTGSFNRLFFVADHDASPSNGNSYFRNVKIYEGSCGSALPPEIVKTQDGIQIGTEGEIGLSLFPNPANEQIQVDLDLPENDGFAQILDVTGRIVWSGEVQSGRNSISIEQHGPGLYIFQVSTLSGETIQTKFVKAH